jgi:hypothetical protein
MATWYTDVATNQIVGNNFPGDQGMTQIGQPPSTFNNNLFEGPPEIAASYTWTGNELANDVINIALLKAGSLVSPNGHVASGLSAPTSTLTLAIGDNDLAVLTLRPVQNPSATSSAGYVVSVPVAPNWVSGATYVYGNVVTDPNSTPANLTYTCVASTTSGTSAPHSAANTVWMPNNQRYSNSIDVHAASGNVAFAGGTQLYGGPASFLPNSVLPNTLSIASGATLLNQPYQIQSDCWLTATILTLNTTNINANAVSVFRVGLIAAN